MLYGNVAEVVLQEEGSILPAQAGPVVGSLLNQQDILWDILNGMAASKVVKLQVVSVWDQGGFPRGALCEQVLFEEANPLLSKVLRNFFRLNTSGEFSMPS